MSDDEEQLMERIDRYPEQGEAATRILAQMLPMIHENCTHELTRGATYLEAFYEYRDDLLARVAMGGQLESREKAWLILYRELSRIRDSIPPMTEAEDRRATARRRDDRIAELKEIAERKEAEKAEAEGRARYQAKQAKLRAEKARAEKAAKARASKVRVSKAEGSKEEPEPRRRRTRSCREGK